MPIEIDITRIRTMITKNYEPVGLYILDMIYIADEPHVVFEWTQREDGQHVPIVFVPIEGSLLEPMDDDEVKFFYRMSVEDPRPNA
jgi:hypothetical protein